MNKPSRIPFGSLFQNRNKSTGANDLFALINLDDAPCALVDYDQAQLAFINSKMIQLTGFSNEEIQEKPVEFLFTELKLSEITSGETSSIKLKRQNQDLFSSEAKLNIIDSGTRWLRIRLPEQTEPNVDSETIPTAAVEKLLEFSRLTEGESFQSALEQGAEIIRGVTGTEGTAIYQADPEAPQFARIAAVGSGDEFPETLPLVDSIRLAHPQIWNPGMRTLTEIHKFGRQNGFTHIATAALSEGNATFGLIVCGGKSQLPQGLTENLLATIATQVRALQQHYLLMENLQKENQSFTRLINLLDAAFSNINEGVIMLSPDLIIQHINPAAEWILGYSSQEVQGQVVDNVLIGTDRLFPALEEAGKGVVTHNIGKVNLNRRNGQSFPALVQVVPVIFKESLIGIEIILNDVSENENNKALAEHLEHRAVLGDYTAAFAHDIRNPINNIALGIQLMSSTLPEEDPNQEVIGRIQNDCTRLSHLMESFLAFSRPSELNLELVDIGQLLQRTLDRWHPRLANAKITPFLKIDENVGKIKGDPRALDRVFTNLISNALDAMSESGDTLAIKAELNDTVPELPMVEVSVSDNGPGIPDDLKDRIFEPFVSASKKGTGLGLAITKQIVTAHKGSINLKTFPGGTVFIVSIPAYLGENE